MDGTNNETAPPSAQSGRRKFLSLGAAFAAAGAATAVVKASPAGATTGAMQFGALNDAGSATTGLGSSHNTATLTVTRVVSSQALVAFRGNHYSVPPGLAGLTLTLTHRLGEQTLDIATSSETVLARHRRQPGGCEGP